MASHLFTFRYYEVESWPVLDFGDSVAEPMGQPALPGYDREPQTIVTRDESFRHKQFEKYQIRHERRVPQMARFKGDLVKAVIFIDDVSAYLHRQSNKMYMNGKQVAADGALRRFRKLRNMDFRKRKIALKEFELAYRGAGDVNRAYFRNLDIMNVRSVGISGDNVGMSQEFMRYLSKGDLSALSIDFMFDGFPREVLVSTMNLIMFRMDNEADALEFANKVNDALTPYAIYDATPLLSDTEMVDDEGAETGELVSDDF